MTAAGPSTPPLSPVGLSVVVRSRSADGDALRAIAALAVQSLPPDEFVAIDSGSAPAVLGQLRAWAASGVPGRAGAPPVALRLIEIPGGTFQSARALNQAVAASRGTLVAILSQDALPADDRYLEHLVAAMTDPRVAGAYGRQVLGAEYHALGEKDLEKTYPPRSRTQEAPDCWFVNTCSIVRRDLFDRHPFDEAALISEDHEWGRWAQSQGYVLKYVAEAVVRHYHHFARWRDLWARYHEEGRGLARIHGRRPGVARTLYGYAREVASDAVWLVRRGHLGQIAASVARRAVKHAALYWGARK